MIDPTDLAQAFADLGARSRGKDALIAALRQELAHYQQLHELCSKDHEPRRDRRPLRSQTTRSA